MAIHIVAWYIFELVVVIFLFYSLHINCYYFCGGWYFQCIYVYVLVNNITVLCTSTCIIYIRPSGWPLGVTVECIEPQITHEKWRSSSLKQSTYVLHIYIATRQEKKFIEKHTYIHIWREGRCTRHIAASSDLQGLLNIKWKILNEKYLFSN